MIDFKGLTHIMTTVILFLIVVDAFDLYFGLAQILLFLILGSVLPDVDSQSSLLGRYIAPISALVKHRNGYTHSMLGSLLLPLPVLLFGINYYLYTVIGYLLHLIADTFNPTGVMWLFPLNKKMYSFNVFKVGGYEEQFILVISIYGIFKKIW